MSQTLRTGQSASLPLSSYAFIRSLSWRWSDLSEPSAWSIGDDVARKSITSPRTASSRRRRVDSIVAVRKMFVRRHSASFENRFPFPSSSSPRLQQQLRRTRGERDRLRATRDRGSLALVGRADACERSAGQSIMLVTQGLAAVQFSRLPDCTAITAAQFDAVHAALGHCVRVN